MPYDFTVIGATGAQGKIVSRDLLEKGYRVLLCGRRKDRIEPILQNHGGTFRYLDLEDKHCLYDTLKKAQAAVTVNCAEADYNLDVERAALKTNSHYVDLGSDIPMTRQQFALHKRFENKNLTALTGCGSVPGIGNVMLKHAAEKLDQVTTANAGFAWSSNKEAFVVPFSIMSIMEEFTETPTILKNSTFKQVPAQADTTVKRYKWVGSNRTFLVRHPEPYTFYRYLKPKGIKNSLFYAGFPEHSYDIITSFIKAGLNSEKTLETGKSPDQLLTEALTSITPPEGYSEKENLWVTLEGKKDGKLKTIRMNCLVPTLEGWEEHGCNIDTGLPCSIIAQLIKEGKITEKGSRSPEFYTPIEPFFKELASKKMYVYENGNRIN